MSLKYNDILVLLDCIKFRREALQNDKTIYDEDEMYDLDIVEFALINISPDDKIIKLEKPIYSYDYDKREAEINHLTKYLNNVGEALFDYILLEPSTQLHLTGADDAVIKAIPLVSSAIYVDDKNKYYQFSLFYSIHKQFVLARTELDENEKFKSNGLVSDNYDLLLNDEIFKTINANSIISNVDKYLKNKLKAYKEDRIKQLKKEISVNKKYTVPSIYK